MSWYSKYMICGRGRKVEGSLVCMLSHLYHGAATRMFFHQSSEFETTFINVITCCRKQKHVIKYEP